MLPYLSLSLGGDTWVLPTSIPLLVLAWLNGMAILVLFLRRRGRFELPFWKVCLFYLLVSVFALGGGRCFHVIWEKPELLATPKLIFSRWDGLTFYGAFGAGFISFVILSHAFFPRSFQKELWDTGAIIVAISYGILRLNCLASGCCWGKLCRLPWAIRFLDARSVMPFLGVPVHPVQIYDSILGFSTGVFLILLHRCKMHFKLFPLFCLLFSTGRFLTEFFRGDALRRSDLLFHLSTSQWLSVLILIPTLTVLFVPREKKI